MDTNHYFAVIYVQQMEDAAEQAREQALLSGAMPSEFTVYIRRQPLGCWPRFVAVLR